jgi:hypothetical protein
MGANIGPILTGDDQRTSDPPICCGPTPNFDGRFNPGPFLSYTPAVEFLVQSITLLPDSSASPPSSYPIPSLCNNSGLALTTVLRLHFRV